MSLRRFTAVYIAKYALLAALCTVINHKSNQHQVCSMCISPVHNRISARTNRIPGRRGLQYSSYHDIPHALDNDIPRCSRESEFRSVRRARRGIFVFPLNIIGELRKTVVKRTAACGSNHGNRRCRTVYAAVTLKRRRVRLYHLSTRGIVVL